MPRSLVLVLALFACKGAGDSAIDDTSAEDTAIDDTGADPISWPSTPLADELAGWDAFVSATGSLDASAATTAYAGGIQGVVLQAEASTGKSWDAAIQARLAVGRPADVVQAELLVRQACSAYMVALIDGAAKAYPTDGSDDEAIAEKLHLAHDLWPTTADLVRGGDAWRGESFEAAIDAAFDAALRGVAEQDEVAVAGGKQMIEKSLFAALHRTVLAQAQIAAGAGATPTAGQLEAQHRAFAAYQLIESRLTDANLSKAKNSWGHQVIERALQGRPDDIDIDLLWTELDEGFSKRAYAYTQAAVDEGLVGTPAGAVKTIEGRTYYTLIAPGLEATLGADAQFTLGVWDAAIAAIVAGDADAAATASALLEAEVCAYMVALGAWSAPVDCATGDSATFSSLLDPAAAPGATWELRDDAAELGPVWKTALGGLKSGISTAASDGALDHAALAGAWTHWKTLRPLVQVYDPDRVPVVEGAFAAMSVAVQAGWSAEAGAGKQTIEKSLYASIHLAVLGLAEEARAGADAAARDRAFAAYRLIEDRVNDANLSKAKNSVGHLEIVAQLTGDPASIDPADLRRELHVAFAKRALAYTVHGLPSSEGGAGLVGTDDGFVKAVEGRTYWGVIADASGADVGRIGPAWDHWIGALRRNDLEEARWASAEIQGAVCAYMQGDLGLTNCSTVDVAVEGGD